MGLFGNRHDLTLDAAKLRSGWRDGDDYDVITELNEWEKDFWVDDSKALWDNMFERSDVLHIICDNTGAELLGDMMMVDYLLEHGLARKVIFHVKYFPTFISDTTISDYNNLLDALLASEDPEKLKYGPQQAVLLSHRLKKLQENGPIEV